MLKAALLSFAVTSAALLGGTAARAQQNDRQLIIYGNDRCPSGTICVRAPETDRYRIPGSLRAEEPLAPADQPWAARASSTSRAGAASGTGSCSASGAGGFTGCWNQMMKEARDDRRAKSATDGASAAPR